MITVLETALPVFLAIAIGMWCRSKNFVTREGIDTLKKVIINLTLPFVLFNAFATVDYTPSSLVLPAIMFVICCIMLVLGFVVIRLSKANSRLAPFLATGFEAGMLGFPLFAMLFPNESASHFAILVLGQELFVFTVFKTLLSGNTSPKAIARDFVTSPTLIAVVLGILVGATGLYDLLVRLNVAGIISAVTDFMSAPTGTIILLAVGYDLVLKEIPWKKTLGLIAMRIAVAGVMLAILVGLNRTVLSGMAFEGAAVLLFILPPPYIIPVVADEPSERVQISSALSALTVITMVLFGILTVVYNL